MAFMAFKCAIDRGNGKYCSRSCARSAVPTKKRQDEESRFWHLVNKNGPIPAHCPELGPCWEWQARRSKQGYGQFSQINPKKSTVLAHRWIFQKRHGLLPWEIAVCHKCDNPSCIRDEHLFAGTRKDNKRDSIIKNRVPRGEDHWFSRYKKEDVIRIRSLKDEFTCRSLAEIFGGTPQAVRAIIKHAVWKHVKVPPPTPHQPELR